MARSFLSRSPVSVRASLFGESVKPMGGMTLVRRGLSASASIEEVFASDADEGPRVLAQRSQGNRSLPATPIGARYHPKDRLHNELLREECP